MQLRMVNRQLIRAQFRGILKDRVRDFMDVCRKKYLYLLVLPALILLADGCSAKNDQYANGTAVSGRVVQGKHAVQNATVRAYKSEALFAVGTVAHVKNPGVPNAILQETKSNFDGTYVLYIGNYTGPLKLVAKHGNYIDGSPNAGELSVLVTNFSLKSGSESVTANLNNLTTLVGLMVDTKFGTQSEVTRSSLNAAECATRSLFKLPISSESLASVEIVSVDDNEVGYVPSTDDSTQASVSIINTALDNFSISGGNMNEIATAATSGPLSEKLVSDMNTQISQAGTELDLSNSDRINTVNPVVAFVGPVAPTTSVSYISAEDGTLGVRLSGNSDSAVSYDVTLSIGACVDNGAKISQQTISSAGPLGTVFEQSSGLLPTNLYCLVITGQDSNGFNGAPTAIDLIPVLP